HRDMQARPKPIDRIGIRYASD
ncbi:hypothetical protein D039_0858B, partial [Vibrio parahaemolyticus EKP-028]